MTVTFDETMKTIGDAVEAYAAGQVAEAVAAKDLIIVDLAAQILALEAEIASKNAEIAILTAAVAAKNLEIAARDATIAARDVEIATLTATVAARDAEIVVLKARIAELEGQEPEPTPIPPPVSPPFPDEMFVKSWFQEAVPEGLVASWQSGGIKPVAAVQTDLALQPTKLPNDGGVLFKKGASKQALTWPVDTDAPWLHRFWVVIARGDLAANPTASDISVLCVNGGQSGSIARQPKVGFNVGTMFSQLNDGAFKTEQGPCSTDFATWNVIVGYRRGYQTQAVVNGVKTVGQEILGLAPNNANSQSFMGDTNALMKADVAIDCVILGQSELDDAQIDKWVGWAMWRAKRQADLPADHPYRNAAPTEMDNPERYVFNQAEWDAWVAATDAIKHSHRGEPAPPVVGYVTVFEDDFTTNTVVDDLAGAPGSNWFAPTHLTGVGVNALAQKVSSLPSCYIHDAANHTLALRLQAVGTQWRTGAFSSVDKNGQGRTWRKGIFEIRCKFPALPSPRPGFFPAFWSYGKEHLFWRTRNRLETDFMEYDGLNGAYINATQHVHKPTLAFADPGVRAADVSKKVGSYEVGPSNGFPARIDIYDGQFHTWYWQFEDDFTYVVLDGLEVARCPTSREVAAEKYIMVDWAYRATQGAADLLQTYDMTIDYIRVQQKGGVSLPAPVIEGTRQVDTYLWAEGKAPFQWKRGGVNIAGATGQSYRRVAADIGTDTTVVDASGLPSNAINCIWARCTYDGPFQLDMDSQNTRYWFNGADYDEATFEGFSWVPDAINGSLINKLFTTGAGGLPFPGFDMSDGFVATGTSTTTDNNTDTSIVDFSNNTNAQWAAVGPRWSIASPTNPQRVFSNGVSQVNSLTGSTILSGVQFNCAAKFRLNDFWVMDDAGPPMRLATDTSGLMPASLTQLRTGAVQSGVNVAAGTIERVAVTSGNVPMLEVQHAMLRTHLTLAYDAEILQADGVDALDIFKDGHKAILNANQNGKIFLYRQPKRGKFKRIAIKSAAIANAKVEGCCFIDSRGDGFYQVAICDQNLDEIRLYEPTVHGDYEQPDWTPTSIVTGKDKLQDVKAIKVPASTMQTLLYTFEGGGAGVGGISKLRRNGASFTNTVLKQQSGAWAVAAEEFSNGDILYGARNGATGRNPSAVPGIYRITQSGAQTTIIANSYDWCRVCKGDFFGLGNEDVAANQFDATIKAFSLFNSASTPTPWAETAVSHTAETKPTGTFPTNALNHGIYNLGYKANGRDAILFTGQGKASVWEWSGSAWAPVQRWDDLPPTFKGDDTIVRSRITRRPKEDIIIADSNNNRLIVLALN